MDGNDEIKDILHISLMSNVIYSSVSYNYHPLRFTNSLPVVVIENNRDRLMTIDRILGLYFLPSFVSTQVN